MRIKKLSLESFQGIKNFTVSLYAGGTTISGRNGAGKTTLNNAICWLLFDKGSDFKQLQPKPIDAEGNPIHGLDSLVEAVFSIEGKSDVVLKKISSEKWTKKRGRADKVFSGHEVKYFINDVPQKMGEYKKTVAKISGGEDLFKLLSSPFYFSQVLSWRDRRSLVMEVCGDTDLFSQVIASNDKLETLPEMLGDHTVDDYRKIMVARRKKTNDELSKIPVRIDELQRGLPDEPEESEKELLKTKEDLTNSLNSANSAIGNAAEVSKKILTLSEANEHIYSKHYRTITDEINKIRQEVITTRREIEDIEHSQDKIESLTTKLIDGVNVALAEKREKFKSVRDESFSPATGDDVPTCKVCGQTIPEDMQKENFEKNIKQQLADINKEGKKLAAEREELLAEFKTIEEKTNALPSMQTKLEDLNNQIAILKGTRDQAPEEATRNTEEIKRLRALATPGEQPAVSQEEKDMLDIVTGKLTAYKRLKEAEQRLEQLKVEEQDLGKQYESCEHSIWMLDEYARSLVAYLEQRVQEFFGGVRFKMFEEQINGGINECCEVLCDGIPFNGGLNHSAQINTGIKIINSFSKYYGVEVPIWVDNAEAVNKIEETPNQLIQLVVSNNKTLTIKEVIKNGE